MAKTGHMYTYDSSQNVTFPAGVSAASFIEGGKYLANKYAAKSHTHNYAASDSAGGPANKVKKALTFGSKTYDGSTAQTITLADLGGQAKGNYVTTDTAQTITGRKTFNSPANVNSQEVATAIFKTSNGGQLIIGKEGPNSGTMLRFDQTAGTTRLRFRASATPGAMVWSQPEKGAVLYFDLTNSAGVSTRTTLDARSGTIARTSDIGNGKITIQKNGTEVGSFTTNQSSGKTINLTLGIDDIHDLRSQLNGKQPSGAYAERQSAETITGNWTFTGTTNFNGTTKVNGNEIASKGYVDGIFDSKLNASEATNFAKFTKFDSDTLKMDGARLYRTSAGDAVDRSSMYGYSSQSTHGTTYTRFAGMATIGSSQAFIGYYQYTNHADGSGGEYIGNITLSNGRLARINGSLSSVNELTDAYAVLSDLNNKANKTHTHAISDITNLQTSLNGKADVGHGHAISEITNLQSKLDGKANAGHTHTISQINTLQDALDGKQNKIDYPCSFIGSNGNYVKLIRAGTNNYYVEIEHGRITYNGSTTQYPEIKVTFPHAFNVASANDKPTVIVSFAPTSNSTGTYEALKVLNVTSTGFSVITRMSSSISGGYFRVNWIAIYTV